VWWQSIAVWFLAAIIVTDLIFLLCRNPTLCLRNEDPVSGCLDRVRVRRAGALSGGAAGVADMNYLRVPDPGDGAGALDVLSRHNPTGTIELLADQRAEQQPSLRDGCGVLAGMMVAALSVSAALAYAARLAVAGAARTRTDPTAMLTLQTSTHRSSRLHEAQLSWRGPEL